MNWLEVSVETDGEAAEAVSEVFNRYGQGGAVFEEIHSHGDDYHYLAEPLVTVKTYLPAGEDQGHLRRKLEEAIWHLGQLYPIPEPRFRELAEEDWAHGWKKHYHPMRVGRRLAIVPSWEGYTATPGEVAITLDPAHSATVTLELRAYGGPARSYRTSYASSRKDLKEDLASAIRDFWPGAEVGEIELTPEDESGAFFAKTQLTLAELRHSSEGALLHPFPRAGSILASVSTRRRKSPVVYENPLQIKTTTRIDGLPDSAHLPDDSIKQGDGWRTERLVRRDGSTATAEWTMELSKTRFEPTEMRSLKSLYRALRAGESTMVLVP